MYWVKLFNVCWKFGVVPSLWKHSIIVPIPKKRMRGVCDANNFRGISLTSLVCKIMCMVLNKRLTTFLEAEGISVDEQGGFRSGRSCRDQILSLLLIGQSILAKRPSGMLSAFIDFKKAYDRVNRKKLWSCLEGYGVNGGFLTFLKGLYGGSVSQVRIGGCLGEEFEVVKGLRQGCVLSPVLFSLYINSLVTELKDRECGVVCGEIMVPGLLFADDTALLAESADDMRKSLQCLQSWCEKWSVEINVEKSAVMHMRKSGINKCAEQFRIGDEVLPWVSTYKYLGCLVDDSLNCSNMVKHRVEMGSRALGAWLRKCRESVGEVNGKSFMKLMQSLVESVLLYGAEIWGCHQKLDGLYQLQLRALRIFFGVGVRHPKVSLMIEADAFPVVWLARMRCVAFWLKVMTNPMFEGRILRAVALVVADSGGGWMKNLKKCMGCFGWNEIGVEEVKGLSYGEITTMLQACARRRVEDEWDDELATKPKLALLRLLKERGGESRCLDVGDKGKRRLMMMIRGGTAPLRIECGRWRGLGREERTCGECDTGKVEDVHHWLLECERWEDERADLFKSLTRVYPNFELLTNDEKLFNIILDEGCKHLPILKIISKMWIARFN